MDTSIHYLIIKWILRAKTLFNIFEHKKIKLFYINTTIIQTYYKGLHDFKFYKDEKTFF